MANKERLEAIKRRYGAQLLGGTSSTTVDNDVLWLIQRAERCEELTKMIEKQQELAIGYYGEAQEGWQKFRQVERWLKALEPHLDSVVCYASTMGEYEPNRVVKEIREWANGCA